MVRTVPGCEECRRRRRTKRWRRAAAGAAGGGGDAVAVAVADLGFSPMGVNTNRPRGEEYAPIFRAFFLRLEPGVHAHRLSTSAYYLRRRRGPTRRSGEVSSCRASCPWLIICLMNGTGCFLVLNLNVLDWMHTLRRQSMSLFTSLGVNLLELALFSGGAWVGQNSSHLTRCTHLHLSLSALLQKRTNTYIFDYRCLSRCLARPRESATWQYQQDSVIAIYTSHQSRRFFTHQPCQVGAGWDDCATGAGRLCASLHLGAHHPPLPPNVTPPQFFHFLPVLFAILYDLHPPTLPPSRSPLLLGCGRAQMARGVARVRRRFT